MRDPAIPREILIVRESEPQAAAVISKELGVSSLISQVLVARNLRTFDECKRFFRPDMSHFHDPFLFNHMEKVVSRILAAVSEGEKIVVYGDYDVDGITGTVVLLQFLQRLGANCSHYIPNRLTDGYGMSVKGIDAIASQKASLVISVDCGITAVEPVAHAQSCGIDTIITDHHEAPAVVPQAFAILNPKMPECPYPFKALAGVGIILKLCHALAVRSSLEDDAWLDYIDIVSVGTAADIVPLVDENRVISKLGFQQLSQTKNVGMQHLLALKKLEGKALSTADVVFLIAPCINAAGRLGDQDRGVKLLMTKDPGEAQLFARELVEINRERQALDRFVQEAAEQWVLQNVNLQDDYAIVAGHEDWHVGVIGISASKIVDRFYRPTFLFSYDKDGIARGSARSIKGFHLVEALRECDDLFLSYGGHSAAAGGSMLIENIPTFRKRFNEVVKSRVSQDDLVPRVVSDTEVTIGDLTPKVLNILKQMGPFGPGNMRPVFLCKGLNNRYPPRVVGKKHLKMVVSTHGQVMDAIAFNYGDRHTEVSTADSFSLAFSLEENVWNGKTSLQMKVKGIAVE